MKYLIRNFFQYIFNLIQLQDEKRSLDHNSVYSKDRSTTRDREGRADDPSAGVSNNDLNNIDDQFEQQQLEQTSVTPVKKVNVPPKVLIPPKIKLSTDEDVQDISDNIAFQTSNEGKGNSCLYHEMLVH